MAVTAQAQSVDVANDVIMQMATIRCTQPKMAKLLTTVSQQSRRRNSMSEKISGKHECVAAK